jgi:ketosteroid isomerase-like protein
MSEENVELMLRGVDAWNRGDLGWFLDHMTEDFEFRTAQLFPDLDPIYSGHDGWRAFWRTWRDAWETVTIRVERIEDLGDRALVVVTFDGVGRGSGVEVNIEVFQLWTFRDGKVARGQAFFDREEALEAVGLRE